MDWGQPPGQSRIALTGTSGTEWRLHEAGAPHVIVTQEQDVLAEVMRITDGNFVSGTAGNSVIALLACGSKLAIGDRNGRVRDHIRLLSGISSSHAEILVAASP